VGKNILFEKIIVDKINEELRKSSNPKQSLVIEKYMKNLFPFLGISSSQRKLICKEYFLKKNLPAKLEIIGFAKLL